MFTPSTVGPSTPSLAGPARAVAGPASGEPPFHAMGQIVFKELPDKPLAARGLCRVPLFKSLLVVGAEPSSGTSPMPPSKAAARSMQSGREKAAELYRQYGPVVYRRCLRLLKDPEASRDATQEVFAKLVRDVVKLGDRETCLPWIYRVTTNHCLNHLRDRKRHAEEPLEPAREVESSSRADISSDRALAHAILSRFDAATRVIAVGVLVDGMDYEEVANAVGVSRRTVARKLERFLEKARELLAGDGHPRFAPRHI
jgi:RNA polymerase sigma-70 factor, ECF subfamily